MEIQCGFSKSCFYPRIDYYACVVMNQDIPEQTELIFNGQHQDGNSNDEVEAIKFDLCNVTKVPQGLMKTFPNLCALAITGSNLKTLTKDDLIEYKNFSTLEFGGNPIEFLPGDLFEGFDNLIRVSFTSCNLTLIEPNIFDEHYDNYLKVCLAGNTNYNHFFFNDLSKGGVASGQSIESFRRYLYEKYYNKIKSGQVKPIKKLRRGGKNFKTPQSSDEGQPKLLSNYLSADIASFINNGTFKDFKIIIDDREFPVHKFLLAARSPTLAEMLRNNPEAENLKLVDISVEIFELILTFLYTDELPSEDGTNFMHLFIAAGRLRIKELKSFAAEILLDAVNAENALEILNMSNKYGHDELRQKAFEEIKENYPEIEFKDEWAEDGEKLAKFIEAFKVREEMMRKAHEEFKKMLI